MAFQIDNLPADQLRLALSVAPAELPEEEALAVEEFIRRIGGRENAAAAVELLEEIERASQSRSATAYAASFRSAAPTSTLFSIRPLSS
jgi:hypothetical protein